MIIYARRTANIPIMNIPSNVPAPPIEATGVPSFFILLSFIISPPNRVPMVPDTYARAGAEEEGIRNETIAAAIGGSVRAQLFPVRVQVWTDSRQLRRSGVYPQDSGRIFHFSSSDIRTVKRVLRLLRHLLL